MPQDSKGYQTALKRINDWKYKGNENARLYLFSLGLTEIPYEILELVNLQELSLDKNELTTIPFEIDSLENLRELEIHHNQLTEIPKEIGYIKNLQKLFLSDNNLTEIPKELSYLLNLQTLDLSNNNLAELPNELSRLKNLEYLDLRGNTKLNLPPQILEKVNEPKLILNYYEALRRINDCNINEKLWLDLSKLDLLEIPKEIEQLENLDTLDLRRNQLTEINVVLKFKNLKKLYLQYNQIENLERLQNLKQLVELNFSYNPVSNIDWVQGLIYIKELFINDTEITNIDIIISELKLLKSLWIDPNQLKLFADVLVKLEYTRLVIWDNGEITRIPREYVSQIKTANELINFFFKTSEGETKELNEAKVLVIGEANVGKTSLVRRLLKDDYDPKRNPTEGIIISKDWKVNINEHDVQLNIWDFGGQEIMHATHQFFLTERSLYILLLDSTVDEEANRIEYWLEKIKILGGSSPVIIVKNKDDLKQLALNQKGLELEYTNIKGFYNVSCQSGQGIDVFKEKLIEEIGKLDGIHDDLPISWFDVKESIENTDGDFISYFEYRNLCQQKGVEQADEEKLIELLHDLGTVLNFKNDARVNDETNVLNPHWVTEAVYKIINARQLFDSKGVLSVDMLKEILISDKYPDEKRMFIVEMMKKFELCFEIPDEKNCYLVPDLLGKEELNTGNWEDSLKFEFHYNVFFKSVFSRLMVKTHKSISRKTYWKTGMVLEYKVANALTNEALVEVQTTKTKNEKIVISIRGKENTRRDFLSQIRGKLHEVHGSFPKEFEGNFEERVPIPKVPEISVSYEHLIELEKDEEEFYRPEGLKEKIRVKELLNGVISENDRRNEDMKPENKEKKLITVLATFVVLFLVIIAAISYVIYLMQNVALGAVSILILLFVALFVVMLITFALIYLDILKPEHFPIFVQPFLDKIPTMGNNDDTKKM